MQVTRQASTPTTDSLRAIEAVSRDLRPDDPRIADWHATYLSHHKHRLAQDLDIVSDNVTASGALLEVGSIPPLLTGALAQSGFTVTGCDIAPERYASAIAALGLEIAQCDIENEALPFAGDSFDAVVFNELFEHLRINPIFTLSEVLRVLKPGGTLLLSSPNLRSLYGIRNFLFRNRAYSCSGDIFGEYRKLEELGHMGHVREYTTTELSGFLERVGFAVTRLVFRGRYANGVARAVSRLVPGLSPFVTYVARKPGRTGA